MNYFKSLSALIILFLSVVKADGNSIEYYWKKSNNVRIINGTDAKAGDAPWQVSLNERQENKDGPFCAGAILTESTILTTCHCAALVAKVICHPDYNDESLEDDIAIIILKTALNLDSKTTCPVHLPSCTYADPTPGTKVTMTGWGTKDSTSLNGANKLQTMTIPIVDRTECQNKLMPPNEFNPPINTVTSNMLCAGDFEGKDSCRYDSGGALVISKGCNAIVVGICSKSTCGYSGYPGVYTRVQNYNEWIKQNTVQ